jgi:methionyl-tRNA synthetase
MSLGRFYVTTPIYYVNDEPHIGHAYTTILADVLARYHRLFGDEVRLQTGTDEHGQKIQQTAAKRGVTPQEQCDEFAKRFEEMWDLLEIEESRFFIRTTQDFHKRAVQHILQKLFDQGDIYKHTYSGWYNVSDEMFIADSDVTEEGKESGRIIQVSEENYFFRLSKSQDWLVDYLERDNPGFILPESRRNEVLGLLRQGISDLCISRPKSRLEWGIELPFDRDYVTYVWIDALVNYISGIGWPDSPEYQKWWDDADVENIHLIGKDILKPHGVFWPIILHAAGIPLPKKILAHGWWTRGGQKESKTVTKALAAQAPVRHIRELIADYGVDPIRYYLIREMTLGMDQDYSEEMIVQRINSDLANDLGNLVSRVTKLIQQYFDSKAPAPVVRGERTGNMLLMESMIAKQEVQRLVGDLKPNVAIDSVLNLIRKTNTYIAECEPWAKAKQGNLEAAGTCLAVALRVLHVAAFLLHPVMPRKMEALLAQIGCPVEKDGVDLARFDPNLPAEGTPVPGGESLFPRLDWKAISERLNAHLPPPPPQEGVVTMDLITLDDFKRVDLRIAEVIEAEKVPKADKLLKLQIRIGEETRQIIAGVAEFYTPEQIKGKQIVVVSNLQPAKIRGIESKGMLLAARDGVKLRLLTLDGEGISSGSKVG